MNWGMYQTIGPIHMKLSLNQWDIAKYYKQTKRQSSLQQSKQCAAHNSYMLACAINTHDVWWNERRIRQAHLFGRSAAKRLRNPGQQSSYTTSFVDNTNNPNPPAQSQDCVLRFILPLREVVFEVDDLFEEMNASSRCEIKRLTYVVRAWIDMSRI